MRRLLLCGVLATAMTTPGLAATPPPSDDGFAAFYKLFAAAVAKDDQKAIAGFTVMSAALDPLDHPTFAQFHKHYLTLKERRCLAAAKPARDIDGTGAVNYYVFCGQLIYGFTKPTAAGWRLTDLSPAD
jgi:hypothetical protein